MRRTPFYLLAIALLFARSAGAQVDDEDELGSFIYLSVHGGANWPTGSANEVLDPGLSAIARGEYSFGPKVRVGAQLSFHAFDAERPGTSDNEGVVNLSLFGRTLGEWGPYRPFALIGLGAYVSKEPDSSRRWDGGVQLGAGFELPVTEYLSTTVGGGFHLVLRGGDENTDLIWVESYLGFVFRQP